MSRLAYLCIDLALLALATLVALLLRENLSVDASKVRDLLPYLPLTLAIAAATILMLGLDRSLWRYSTMTDYLHVAGVVGASVLGATLLTFLFERMEGVSRSIPILQFLLGVVLLVGARVLARTRLPAEAAAAEAPHRPVQAPGAVQQGGRQTVLCVGLSRLSVLYLRSVEEFAAGRVRIGGIIGHRPEHAGKVVCNQPVFGPEESIASAMRKLAVHGVFVDSIVVTTGLGDLPPALQQQLADLEGSDVRVEYLAEQLGLAPHPCLPHEDAPPAGPEADGTVPVFRCEALRPSLKRPYWRIKRAVDACLAGLLLIVLGPFMLIISAAVAMSIGTPSVFWQDRPGRRGVHFKLFKFRTMGAAHDSEGRAIPDHERIEPVGRFLRATRLDELPQIWNVLIGEMSFIGPRPLLHVDQHEEGSARLLVRPGVTGWAQVMGGRHITAADKAALDVWYVQNASLRLDLEILVRTVPMVLLGERMNTHAIARAWSELHLSGVCQITGISPATPSEPPQDQPSGEEDEGDIRVGKAA